MGKNMRKCNFCSEILSDNAKFCPQCGKRQYKSASGKNVPLGERAAAIISYIYWIGFAVSVCLGDKDSEFVKFHQNQAFILHLATIVFWLVSYVTRIKLLYSIAYIFIIIFWIFGIVCAARHEIREIPFFSKIQIIR